MRNTNLVLIIVLSAAAACATETELQPGALREFGDAVAQAEWRDDGALVSELRDPEGSLLGTLRLAPNSRLATVTLPGGGELDGIGLDDASPAAASSALYIEWKLQAQELPYESCYSGGHCSFCREGEWHRSCCEQEDGSLYCCVHQNAEDPGECDTLIGGGY